MRTFRTVTTSPIAPPTGPTTRPRLRGLVEEVRRYQRPTKRLPHFADPRHSAIAVLTAAAVVVASQAALALALAGMPGVRDPLYADKAEKLRASLDANPSAKVVVQFGSSRTSNALRGLDLRPTIAFNFGIPATGPVVQGVYLRRWLDEGRRTDLVLLEMFPAQMASQMPRPMESYFVNPERFDAAETGRVVTQGFAPERFGAAPGVSALFRYRLQILGRMAPALLPWNARYDSSRGSDAAGWLKGIVEDPTPEQRAAGVARANAEYANLLQTLRLDGPAASALRDSLSLCRERGVKAAVVLMPEGTSFAALYTDDARRRVEAYVADLARDFGPVVIDARGWLADAAFIDGHHALPSGASTFTARLGERIAPLLEAADAPH